MSPLLRTGARNMKFLLLPLGARFARHRLAYTLGALFALFLLGVVTLGARAYRNSLREQRPPHGPVAIPRELAGEGLEHVSYRIPGGLEVRGWYVPSRSGAALLFVHGQPGTRLDLVAEARALVAVGYGALLIDIPGHGESSGIPDWGESARDAVTGGITFLSNRPEVQPGRIGALGFSTGSSATARGAAGDRRVGAVALAGIFTTAAAQIEHEYRKYGLITRWPALRAARDEGLRFDWLKPVDFIGTLAPTPVLFIAGSADQMVPQQMTEEVFNRAGEPKELALIAGAGHGRYAAVAGAAYFDRLRSFFDHRLSAARAP